MKTFRPGAPGQRTSPPAGSMTPSQYLKAIATLSDTDPILDVPVHVPPGWVLPADAVLGKPLLWIIRHVMGVELWPTQAQIVDAGPDRGGRAGAQPG